MTINLELFCDGHDATRPYLAKPFSQGEFTFATDGRIAVRVPKLPQIRRRKKPEVTKVFAECFEPKARFRSLPVVVGLEPVECPACRLWHKDYEGPYECDFCRSTHHAFPSVWVGPNVFNGRYITLIQNLPDIRVALSRKIHRSARPMQFEFDGGDGLLMPLRGPLDDLPVIAAALN